MSNLLLSDPQVINCDRIPTEIDGYTIVSHVSMPNHVWSEDRVDLYTSTRQKTMTGILGEIILNSKMPGRLPLNANYLEDLLSLGLIPNSWERLGVCFWGTIYKNDKDEMFVRHASFRHGSWTWRMRRIKDIFHGNFPAAVVKWEFRTF